MGAEQSTMRQQQRQRDDDDHHHPDPNNHHPQMMRRDLYDQAFSYPGWEADVQAAERTLVECPEQFYDFLFQMKKKQCLHLAGARGSTSHHHQSLQSLYAQTFTYPGWHEDVKMVEQAHVNDPDMFQDELAVMKNKQRVHLCDRSSQQLRTLDAQSLTNDGWRDDFKEAEISLPREFDSKLASMKKKQQMHLGDRSHPQLQALDAQTFDYPGWRVDWKEAEDVHIHWPGLFNDELDKMKKKQKMHEGDRSHEQLLALDAQTFSYPGWEDDVKEAEKWHTDFPMLFQGHLASMKQKQDVHHQSAIESRGQQRRAAVGSSSAIHGQPQTSTKRRNRPAASVADNATTTKPNTTQHRQKRQRIMPPRHSTKNNNNNDNNDDDNCCHVCLDGAKTHAFVPCGHLCVCQGCASKLRCCPMCQQDSTQVLRIFQ